MIFFQRVTRTPLGFLAKRFAGCGDNFYLVDVDVLR